MSYEKYNFICVNYNKTELSNCDSGGMFHNQLISFGQATKHTFGFESPVYSLQFAISVLQTKYKKLNSTHYFHFL